MREIVRTVDRKLLIYEHRNRMAARERGGQEENESIVDSRRCLCGTLLYMPRTLKVFSCPECKRVRY